MFIFPMKCCHLGVMKPQFWGLNRQETRWDKPGSSGLGSVDPTWMVPKVQLDVYSPKYGNNRFNPCEFAIYIYIRISYIYIYIPMCPHLLKKNTYTVIYHIPNVQQSISPGSCPIPLARACAVGRSIRAANFFFLK